MRIIRFALAAALALLALPASAFAVGPAPVTGTLTVPATVNGVSDAVTSFNVTGGATNGDKIDIYARVQNSSTPQLWMCVANTGATVAGGTASGTNVAVVTLVKSLWGQTPTPVNGTKIEWALADDGGTSCTPGTTTQTANFFSAAATSTLSGPTVSISAPALVNGSNDTVTYSATTPSFANPTATVTILIYARKQATSANSWVCVAAAGVPVGSNSSVQSSVTLTGGTSLSTQLTGANAPSTGDTIEWLAIADTGTGCGASANEPPSSSMSAQGTSSFDNTPPTGFAAAPPQTGADSTKPPVACTSFELFGVAKDTPAGIASFAFSTNGVTPLTASGIGPRTAATPGPTVVTKVSDFTFPSGASGQWQFSAQAQDVAGNSVGNASVSPPTILFLNVSNASQVGACTDYPDLAGHWAAVYARYLSTNTANTPALFQGMPAPSGSGTIFGPDVTMTRAMLAKVLVSAVEPGVTLPTSAPSGCSFTDVPTGQWYTGYVWEACRLGLMTGEGNGVFAPNDPLTRGQAATAIDRLNQSSVPSTGYLSGNPVIKASMSSVAVRGTPSFTDVPIGQYYTSAVLDLYARDVIDGTSATTFSPDATLTRGQLAKILYRALAQATTL